MLRRLAPERVKRWYRWVTQADSQASDQEMKRLQSMPRYTKTTSSLLGPTIGLVDSVSFLAQYRVIFAREKYRFTAKRPNPVFLDCGANIGLMSIYWKRAYPRARIIAFEPDPDVFEVLSWNVAHLGLSDIELVQKAVWTCADELPFWVEGADAGRLVQRGDDTTRATRAVQTARLRDYLDMEIDMLKLDIEGAEVEVILDCADRLNNVHNVLVEYHSFHSQKQRIDELLHALLVADFRLHVLPDTVSPQPFLSRLDNMGMDLQLDIFAYRA